MNWSPWQQCWVLAGSIYALAKFGALAADHGRIRDRPLAARLAWLFLWPGMEPASDLRRMAARPPSGAAGAASCLLVGATALLLAPTLGGINAQAGGLLAAAAVVLVLHFGLLRLVAAAWHGADRNVRPLMDAPGFTPSLGELWGRRWNSAFSALARRFIVAPLAPRIGPGAATLSAFAASGLVHELVFTLPVGPGALVGGPTAYFLIQGLGTLFERSHRGRTLGLGDGSIRARAFAMACVLLPLPLLLNEPVLTRIALPLAQALPGVPSMSVHALLGVALWLAVLAHACVLVAGAQLPRVLRWSEELSRLSRFNRSITWVYYGFIGMIVTSFALLTATLHEEMLRGDRAAVALALLIAVFWTARLVVDAIVFRHADWPAGRRFAAGHALLIFAFVGMAITYWGVVVSGVMS